MALLSDEKLLQIIADQVSFPNLTDREREEVTRDLSDCLRSKVNVAVLERLSEAEREEVVRLADHAAPAEILHYLQTKITDLEILISTTTTAVLADFKQLRGY